MSELCEHPQLFERKSLTRRADRNRQRVQLIRLGHTGKTLACLEREEAVLLREFHTAGRTATELCTLARALEIVRERRRILLGEPLPGSRRPARGIGLLDVGTLPQPAVLDVQPVETVAAAIVAGACAGANAVEGGLVREAAHYATVEKVTV